MNRRPWALAPILLLALPFIGAEGPDNDRFLAFLFAAFAVTWVAFFAYAWFIARKQADLKQEIESLSNELGEDGDGSA